METNLLPKTTHITDQELYRMARIYGKRAIFWRRKFMGLLPEISKRKIYEKKGFSSIYEFSFKLAGLSEDQVRRVFNLEKRFNEMPILKNLLSSGEVSVSKLARVASIATLKNQESLAEVVKTLPRSAVETLVKDEKFALNCAKFDGKDFANSNQNGLFKPQIEVKSVPGTVASLLELSKLNLNSAVTARLLELQNKGIDLNQVLTELLDRREEEIQQEKAKIAEEIEQNQARQPVAQSTKPSRYIPARVRKIIQKEHGTKCSIPNCNKPAEQLHHTQIFALSHAHNPAYLAPLCKNHHTLAHSVNIKVQEEREKSRV
ncbi:MAG: hypothetical protein WC897_05160 [Candidatus Gracilibacteria bacterium]